MALIAYWLNIFVLGHVALFELGLRKARAWSRGDMPAQVPRHKRRILIAQALYAFGALLCILSTYWSIGFIVLVQLNYAIAPRFGRSAE